MARIYHPKDKELFQRQQDGKFYTWLKGSEICLDTNDFAQAKANKEYHKALVNLYGPAAFKSTVGKLFPIYLTEISKKKNLRPTYIKSIEWYWTKYLEAYWGKKKLIDINQSNWDHFCSSVQKKFDVSDFTNHRSTLTGFMAWASRKRFMLAIPSLENPIHKKRKRKIITPDHLRLIFQYANGGLRDFLTIALFTGMRRGEIVKLKWKQIIFERRALVLADDDVKTGEGREIPINDAVVNCLTARLASQQDTKTKTKWVFPNRRDPSRHMDLSGFKLSWRLCIEKANLSDIGYTWHDFRSTYEKYMHKALGFTDTQKEKMAGSSIDVQKQLYVSMNADDLRGLENVVQVEGLTDILEKPSEGEG